MKLLILTNIDILLNKNNLNLMKKKMLFVQIVRIFKLFFFGKTTRDVQNGQKLIMTLQLYICKVLNQLSYDESHVISCVRVMRN